MIQCAYRVHLARLKKEEMIKWKEKIHSLYNKVLGRKLVETWQKVQFCFVSWVEYYERNKRIKQFQKDLLLTHRRGDMKSLYDSWKTFLHLVKSEKDAAARVLQRWCRQIKANQLAETIRELQKFENQAVDNVKAKEKAVVEEELSKIKPPSRRKFRLPTSQLYSPYLAKLTDTLQDVIECEDRYFNTNILSADREYMQQYTLKTPEQKSFLIDQLKENIQSEKDRLRRRRRRSSTMWQSRLKEAAKDAMKMRQFG
jgi:hypothetical protein